MEVRTGDMGIGCNEILIVENGAEIIVSVEATQLGARISLEGRNCDLAGESPGVYETVDNTSPQG